MITHPTPPWLLTPCTPSLPFNSSCVYFVGQVSHKLQPLEWVPVLQMHTRQAPVPLVVLWHCQTVYCLTALVLVCHSVWQPVEYFWCFTYWLMQNKTSQKSKWWLSPYNLIWSKRASLCCSLRPVSKQTMVRDIARQFKAPASFPQRTCIWFPGPTCRLTTICNSSSRVLDYLLTFVATVHTC